MASYFIHADHETGFFTCLPPIAGSETSVWHPAMLLPVSGDKRLAETHDFIVTLAFRIKIGTAFARSHRQGRQCILERLFECQELQDGQIDGRIEDATLPCTVQSSNCAECGNRG